MFRGLTELLSTKVNQKFYIKRFWETHKSLVQAFFGLLAMLAFYEIVLLSFNEPDWFIISSEVGVLLSSIGYGVLASFIFYYAVVFLPLERRRVSFSPYVSWHVYQIILNCYSHLSLLAKNSHQTVSKLAEISPESFCQLWQNVNPENGFGSIGFKTHFLEMFETNKKLFEDLEKVRHDEYQVTVFISRLSVDCRIYGQLKSLIGNQPSSEYFKSTTKQFLGFIQALVDLNSYWENNFHIQGHKAQYQEYMELYDLKTQL